ncbi:hypothetical protein [Bythopirellula goksoeyrii]|uniref:Dockerin domain-containing protein n=1 Tax=Bythopirellula goksoeyrii TaxID=1400387 RepID=A0A5B9Q613_9BACT|nr:hypothetical protein [Bythopirellula goksoeyrii]QEG33139.1 hypothetical protein Pr1d_04000 [Bythopirellula goksoeyrii]
MRIHSWLLVGAICFLLMLPSAQAEFDTIINAPPDTVPTSIDSNTQLNLSEGGAIGSLFHAGHFHGTSTNVEVNIMGGTVDDYLRAYNGSTVNISGGSVGNHFESYAGSVVNITGGTVGRSYDASLNSLLNVSGGSVGTEFTAGFSSIVNISGGSFDERFIAKDSSKVRLSGGTFGRNYNFSVRVESGSEFTLVGNEFRVNGTPLTGLETLGTSLQLDLTDSDLLSGIFADGTPFAFHRRDDSFASGTLHLESATIPSIGPAIVNASTDPLPLGIRNGQTLWVRDEAVVPHSFNLGLGSTLLIEGGALGRNLEAVDATVNILGGSVGDRFDALAGSAVNVSGGSIGDYFFARDSTVTVAGGTIGSFFRAADSTVDVFSGSLGHNTSAEEGSEVRFIGGEVPGRYIAGGGSTTSIAGGLFNEMAEFLAYENSSVHLYGTQFELDGQDITSSLTYGSQVTIFDRDVRLTGLLADGSPITIDLYLEGGSGADIFSPNAQLTITLIKPGDFDQNGVVNADDLTDWRSAYGTTTSNPFNSGDGDGDRDVDGSDFLVWQRQLASYNLALSNDTVPEPTALMLGIFAALVMISSQRVSLF